MLPPLQLEQTIAKLVREDWGRILASLVSSFRDWQLAEDVLQDSVEKAITVWQRDGLPDAPAAWLLTTARRKAIDHFRRSNRFAELQPELAYLIELDNNELNSNGEPGDIDERIPDKRLELIFTCCHPAIEPKTQVALTLRTLGGLTTEEIAAAFFDKKATMAQRLARATNKIESAGIPFEIPPDEKLDERISSVLSVIYLIFNEGYTASSGAHIVRTDLADEAIRLGHIVQQLLPEQTEVSGLLALMLLHDSRRTARQDKHGMMISLEHQNRKRWNKAKIETGTKLLKDTLKKQRIGVYQLQAAISAVHAESSSWKETDWAQINALYEVLYKTQPSAVVRVNQAMAHSYAESAESALDMLASVADDKAMQRYQPFYAARADMHSRTGNASAAKDDFKTALSLSDNESVRQFLQKRLNEID